MCGVATPGRTVHLEQTKQDSFGLEGLGFGVHPLGL